MIGIIDYGMGNLRSVMNAFEAIEAPARLVRHPEDLSDLQAYVLPGVGAFGDGMENLRRSGLIAPLAERVLDKRHPLLGICLGMQLLATEGMEGLEDAEQPPHRGLGWIPGRVTRLEPPADSEIRVPHMGWNNVTMAAPSMLYDGLPESCDFYFVHSYVFVPEDPSVVSGYCTHGQEFAASVQENRIQAVQFHPEKSHHAGLKVLSNWWRGVQPC